jgi:hypothetical protein
MDSLSTRISAASGPSREREEAANVCIHADPRCIDDPCPYGIWRVLCDPSLRAHEQAGTKETDDE